MKDDSLFAFAGIWDRWKSPTGQVIESCSILTTTPNELLTDVHSRMPVILPLRHHHVWLMTPASEAERLAELLLPFDSSLMTRHWVSSLVNKPQNDTPECAMEAPSLEIQAQLW
jgi:putative SOS response-associated peptidase YedK